MDETDGQGVVDLDEEIRQLSTSISLHDTSDEEFELSSGFGNDYEGMLLLRIRKLESEITDLQSRLEQNKSNGLAETAESMLHKQIQEISSKCSISQSSHHSYLKKLVKLNAALTGIKFTSYDWDVLSRDDTVIRRRYSYDGKAGNMSFKIAFEVKVQRADEDTEVQNVQVTLNDNASDELKFYIQSLGNDLGSIFAVLSQYSMWADTISAKGTNPRPEHPFIHPYVQTIGMFIGEASCLLVFVIVYYYHKLVKKNVSQFGAQKFSCFLFVIPAACDVLGTSTMYVGLNLTYASSFQMLRGSVIIFTALLSVAFFGSKLQLYHWAGMLMVVMGLIVVGLGDVIGESGSNDVNSVLTGDLLIVLAQIIAAIQMTVEQLLVKGYNIPPLQGVGWEGLFGFIIVGTALIPMYYIPWHLPSGQDFWQDHTRFEDVMDGFHQIFYIPTLTMAFLGTVISIGFFNFAGLSVTKKDNAITRMVLDSLRTLFIWMIGLAVQWQRFNYFQPIGFLCLVIGTCIFYNVVFSHILKRLKIWPSMCGAPDGEE